VQVVQPNDYWKFDDGSGTTAADSGSGAHNGTLVGSPTWTTGVIGGALAFNGTSQSVSVPALGLDSNTVTISAWIYRTASESSWAGIVFDRNSSSGATGLNFGTANELRYTWNNSASTYNWNSGLTVPTSQWTFVALVITASNATMYMKPLGGALQSATNSVANSASNLNGASYIGQDSSGGRYFSGTLDDVRIYNSSLGASAIGSIANLAPTLATAAAASPSPVTGTTYALSVLGADSDGGGEPNLSYTWSYTGPANVTFSDNGDNTAKNAIATLSQPGAYTFTATITDLGGQSTASSVSVTIGSQGQWNAASAASWSAAGSWTDSASGAAVAAPGVRGMTGDTALFSAATGGTARLDGASPTLAGITFNSTATSYTVAQGSGGSITLQAAGGASVNVLSGSHFISAPLTLASGTNASTNAGTTLAISGNISGSGSFTKSGNGVVVLSGANTYGGGTIVTAGKLVIMHANSLLDGSNLTVGAAAAFAGPVVPAPPAAGSAPPASSPPSPPASATTITSRAIYLPMASQRAAAAWYDLAGTAGQINSSATNPATSRDAQIRAAIFSGWPRRS
jgi:autotransporter-associated beta strand protein